MKDIYRTIQYKGKEYRIVFNLNVMERIQEKYGSIDEWGKLTDKSEPDISAVIFGYQEMLNEGIEIENEENGTNLELLSHKQVGRMITDIGLEAATQEMTETVIESSKNDAVKNGSSTKTKKK